MNCCVGCGVLLREENILNNPFLAGEPVVKGTQSPTLLRFLAGGLGELHESDPSLPISSIQ